MDKYRRVPKPKAQHWKLQVEGAWRVALKLGVTDWVVYWDRANVMNWVVSALQLDLLAGQLPSLLQRQHLIRRVTCQEEIVKSDEEIRVTAAGSVSATLSASHS